MKRIQNGEFYIQYKDLVLINEYNKITHIKLMKYLDEYISEYDNFVFIEDEDLRLFLNSINIILTYPIECNNINEYLTNEYNKFKLLYSSVTFEMFFNNLLEDIQTIHEYHSDRTSFSR